MRLKILHLLLLSFVFLINEILSQPQSGNQDIKFELYTVNDGLPDDRINTLIQDSYGYLWIGTEDGLIKYDGYEFIAYKPVATDSLSISDRQITSIFEDRNNVLWIGTRQGGINKYNRDFEIFEKFQNDSGNTNLSSCWVTFFYESPTDSLSLWIGTRGQGLLRLNKETGAITTFDRNYRYPNSLSSNDITSIFEDPQDKGIFWIGALKTPNVLYSGGLNRFDTQNGSFTQYMNDPENENTLSDDNVSAVYIDKEGIIWIGTWNGLNRFDRIRYYFKNYNTTFESGISDSFVTSLFEDESGLLWIGTKKGLNRLDRSTDKITSYRNLHNFPNNLNADEINVVFEDFSGILWCGTQSGLNKLNRSIRNFPHFQKDPLNPNSLINNRIHSFLQDKSGDIWIGTRGGLELFERQNGTFRHFIKDSSNITNSISDNSVFSIYEAFSQPGILWIGTGEGLNKFEKRTEKFTHFRYKSNDPYGISHDVIVPILEDSQRRLWIGTYGGGLNIINRNTNKFEVFNHDPDNKNSLSHDRVSALYERRDKSEGIWVGTWGGGLQLFNPDKKEFKQYFIDPGDTTSNKYFVVELYEDRKGNFWICTRNLGLFKLNDKGDFIEPYFTELEGLPHNGVMGIVEDYTGQLWISTMRGLSKFDPLSKTFTNYDVNDGLQGNEFIRKSAYRAENGELFFGGENGFNAFFPYRVSNPFPPIVNITSFKIYNQKIIPGGDSPLSRNIADTKIIDLSYDQNDIAFEYVGFHYKRPDRNKYAYMLVNYDTDWRNVEFLRSAIYTNLEPGEYEFRVKSSNSDGIWNETGASIKIYINKPYWLSFWAYGLYAAVFGLLLFRMRHSILNREREKTRLREAELRTQAAEAEARAIKAEDKRKTHELEEARKLQLSMLPEDLPVIPNLELNVYMKTANEVGGDYYDFITADDGTFIIAIGDATGHGLKASTMVSVIKWAFYSDASRISTRDFFEKCTGIIKKMNMWNLYMALTVMKIKDYNMSFSAAGMPPVYIYRKKIKKVEEIILKGMPLGAFADFPYSEKNIKLEKGDSILLLTDGFPELFNREGKILKYQKVGEIFKEVAGKTPDEIIKHLVQTGENWRNDQPQNDDITFLVVKIK